MRKNHKIKAALFAGLAGTMLFGSYMTAYAAGVTKANGKLYYYQADGSLGTGLIHDTASDKYYYALSDGSLVTGWLHLDQDYYYMNDDGALWTGWRTISGSRYYFYPESGKCALNVAMEIGGSWYLFGTDGKMQTGFQNVNGNTYYFDPSTGVMYAGTTRTINGISYTFNANGTCTTHVDTANSFTIGDEANNQNKKPNSQTTQETRTEGRFPCCNSRFQQILVSDSKKEPDHFSPGPGSSLSFVLFFYLQILPIFPDQEASCSPMTPRPSLKIPGSHNPLRNRQPQPPDT